MKLPPDSIITPEKLTSYLLVFSEQNDKSKYLEQGGFNLDNWQMLESELRNLLENEAVFQKEDTFGEYYVIIGQLFPSGIRVKTIWLKESGSEIVRFITLIPLPKL